MQFFILVLGSLGLFMYGMKTLSLGLQKAAGENLRALIQRLAYNDFSGILTGAVLTLLVQSSTATSVLFVGLANAGLIHLRQAIALIMGACMGTTAKALLLAYSGVNINLQVLALFFAAFALPLLLSQRNRLRAWSDVLFGLAIMFLSIGLIASSLDHIEENQTLVDILSWAGQAGFGGNILALLTAMVLTMIIQSSSAVLTLTLVLSQKGIVSFEMAAAMVIGENIGTTVTANLAALVANKNAKRVGLFHTLFKVFGSIWALLLFYPILNGIDILVQNTTSAGSPFTNDQAVPYALAFFHVGFNLVNTLLLVGFIPHIEKLLYRILRDKEEDADKNGFTIQHFQSGIIGSPELDMVEVKKAVERLGLINQQMFRQSEALLTRNENTAFYDNLKRIKENEELTDKLERDICEFLNKVSENDISKTTSHTVRTYLSVTQELERLADSIYQLSKVYERKLVDRTWFNPTQREGIRELIRMEFLLLEQLNELLANGKLEDEDKFDREKNLLYQRCEQLRNQHLSSIEQPDFNIKSGTVFMDLIALYQRMAEQVNSIRRNYSNQ